MTAERERLASACIFPGFAGTTAPDWLRRELALGLGGVVLFAWNVDHREQVRRLTDDLHAERPDVVVAVDEEGGDVTRLDAVEGSPYPGNLALGAVDDVQLTGRVARAMAADLRAVGVDLDLAPVADVNTNPQNPIVGVRAFGSDPDLVARHVAAFVAGLQAGGVAACAKHFPGHGDTSEDSHLALPTVTASAEALRRAELAPFRAAIAAGVRAIMTAHLLVPAFDTVPATVSRVLLHDVLRVELGFEGLVVTDALEMRAISAGLGVEEGAVQALAAGADALCLGHDLAAAEVAAVRRAIVTAVESGRLPERRLAEAAGRVERVAVGTAATAGADPEAGRGRRRARDHDRRRRGADGAGHGSGARAGAHDCRGAGGTLARRALAGTPARDGGDRRARGIAALCGEHRRERACARPRAPRSGSPSLAAASGRDDPHRRPGRRRRGRRHAGRASRRGARLPRHPRCRRRQPAGRGDAPCRRPGLTRTGLGLM